MKAIRGVTVFLILAVFASRGAAADQKGGEAPEWLREVKTGRPGSFPLLKPCRLTYVFSWSNIVKAGKADIAFGARADEKFPGKIVGESSGGSKGMARVLWPYDHAFTSVIDPRSLQPVAFSSIEIDRKETLWTTNTYSSSGVSVKEIALDKASGTKVENTMAFPFSETHDLMSAFLYARSFPLKTGDTIAVLSYPFGSAYLGRFTVLGREKHEIGLGEFDAIKLDIEISKVQSDLQLKDYSKFKKATVWVSDDEFRVPLEVRADIFVGSVRVTLAERELLEKKGAPPGSGAVAGEAVDAPAPQPSEGILRKWFSNGKGARGVGRAPFRKR